MLPNYIKIVLSFMISNAEKHNRTILENNLRWELGVSKRNVVKRTGRRRYNIIPMLRLHALQINAAMARRKK